MVVAVGYAMLSQHDGNRKATHSHWFCACSHISLVTPGRSWCNRCRYRLVYPNLSANVAECGGTSSGSGDPPMISLKTTRKGAPMAENSIISSRSCVVCGAHNSARFMNPWTCMQNLPAYLPPFLLSKNFSYSKKTKPQLLNVTWNFSQHSPLRSCSYQSWHYGRKSYGTESKMPLSAVS